METLIQRPRRLRSGPVIRKMVRETHLQPENFIYPLFAVEGQGVRVEIPALPGVFHLSVDELVKEAKDVYALGIHQILLFGVPDEKDEQGSGAWDAVGIVQKAIRAIKSAVPGMYIITDICLCQYTSHGHCGVLNKGGEVMNDPTLELLSRIALSHCEAGADMVAPSDMMDGRIAAMRQAMDEAGYTQIPIMAYSAKFASSYYGPFREAAHSAPAFGDRKTYQMDFANGREALREVLLDVAEGADIVMVKPALAYLDVIHAVKQEVRIPVAAYNVSGEYSMLKMAIAQGLMNESVIEETLMGMKRAGADLIITYFAKELVQKWRDNHEA